MRPQYSITQHPNPEPITYDQASAHLRVDSLDDMEYITELIQVAREYVDAATGRASIRTGYNLTAETWDDLFDACETGYIIPIFRTPLAEVVSVKYYAPDASTLTTMSESDYRVITLSEPGRIQLTGNLPSVDDRPDAIQIEFYAGSDIQGGVSASQRHAIKMLVAHLYENRVPSGSTNIVNEIPFGLQSLIDTQKIGGWFQ